MVARSPAQSRRCLLAAQLFGGAFDLSLIGGDNQIEIILSAFSGELKADAGRGSGYDGKFIAGCQHGQAPLMPGLRTTLMQPSFLSRKVL